MKQDINIKALRQERGWNQCELALRLGVDQTTVSRWENGREMSVTARKLFDIVIQEKPSPTRNRGASKRKTASESLIQRDEASL